MSRRVARQRNVRARLGHVDCSSGILEVLVALRASHGHPLGWSVHVQIDDETGQILSSEYVTAQTFNSAGNS